MPAILDEHKQWVDSSGRPLVGGKVYFGVQNADPKVSPQAIFSDRDFATPISQPQILDADGRTTNKVYIKDRYSILVDDLNDVQQYQELDNGEPGSVGVVTLDNVVGANTIAATASPTITAYVDKETYVFKTASINTGAVTLDIDGVGAKSVTHSNGDALVNGQWAASQIIKVIYNLTSDTFVFEQFNLISQADAEAGTSTVSHAISALRLAQAVAALSGLPALGTALQRLQVNAGGTALEYAAPPAFTESFVSADQTITLAGSLTLAHSLSSAPTLVQVRYKCTVADIGYSVDDEVILGEMDLTASSGGVSVVPDATNLNIRYGSSTTVILNKTTGTSANMLLTSWRAIFLAWA